MKSLVASGQQMPPISQSVPADCRRPSRRGASGCLSAAADLERHYRPTAGGEPTVMRSLFAKEPRPEVVVGKGSSNFVFLSHLANGLRDRLVKIALGFAAALRPKT